MDTMTATEKALAMTCGGILVKSLLGFVPMALGSADGDRIVAQMRQAFRAFKNVDARTPENAYPLFLNEVAQVLAIVSKGIFDATKEAAACSE